MTGREVAAASLTGQSYSAGNVLLIITTWCWVTGH